MYCTRLLINIILVYFVDAEIQANLHQTDYINGSNYTVYHDCLLIPTAIDEMNATREIISYCMSELTSKFDIEINHQFPKFTFGELAKQNITSEQLYSWSAPIDVAERYQLYLNQLLDLTGEALETEVFYNCTFPRFGTVCQYEMDYSNERHASLHEIIRDYYSGYTYQPTNLTCYTHLKCDHGPSPACLDWREICNGNIDCLDGNFDEKDCWQLEINECNENEYQCSNGQCIPKSFYKDSLKTHDCIDTSDELEGSPNPTPECRSGEPSFKCEEKTTRIRSVRNAWSSERKSSLIRAMYSMDDKSVSTVCLSAFKSLLKLPIFERPLFDKICDGSTCLEIIQHSCPDMFYFPNIPLFFGDIYFAYTKNDSLAFLDGQVPLPYICYTDSHYERYPIQPHKLYYKNRTCFRKEWVPINFVPLLTWEEEYIKPSYKIIDELKSYNKMLNYNAEICNRSNMYKCHNSSKCLAAYRLLDSFDDCPGKDDENLTHIRSVGLTELLKNHFKCILVDTYIHPVHVKDSHCDCEPFKMSECEDEDFLIPFIRKKILFQTICDGFNEIIPILVEGKNLTDETECEKWSCNNIYTHCDGIWNCPNGEDEAGCYSLQSLNCSSDYHMCVLPETNRLICLPLQKVNDGKIDCLGATDEFNLCSDVLEPYVRPGFYCLNQTISPCVKDDLLCDKTPDCNYGDDEQFCVKDRNNITTYGSICRPWHSSIRSDVERFLCDITKQQKKLYAKDFSLVAAASKIIHNAKHDTKTQVLRRSSTNTFPQHEEGQCHRGFYLRVWLNDKKNLTKNICLCPPSYYGDRCQYQNQRVSLTIRFQGLSDSWSTLFAIVISLIDNSEERIIHSYEQFTYLSVRDCQTKFNIYLLYATRPKSHLYNYSIHIDIYEKMSLNYRGSLLYPITFPFLPVHRLAYIANIPSVSNNVYSCIDTRCKYGACIRYSNNLNNDTFCQCDPGWSGRYCNISYQFNCSSDSKCIGVSAYNRPICVCPIHKFGYRCLLENTICQKDENSTCHNGGQCIPADEYMSSSNQKFTCICPKNYHGDQCEIPDNKIIFSFEKNITVSQAIFIHFFQVTNHIAPIRSTTFRTIPYLEDSLIIYWSRPFHFIFIELSNKVYYLAAMQNSYNTSATITKIIKTTDRCQNMSELFDEEFVKMHPLRRIKHYHRPCQNKSLNLTCFYDNERICFCYNFGKQRLSNCFDFDHNMKMNCAGQSVCENDGQCFQDKPDCPERSMCVCQPCYYGVKCQFSTNGFGLSLDAILGYQIQPKVNLIHQPKLVIISSILTIIFILIGLINGIIALITFNRKSVLQVGCGLYLLGSSITTLLITIVFGLKFWILLLAQMTYISNQSFLKVQCISLDFLLQIFLNMDQWLSTCVVVERTITAVKATRFSRVESKKAAKVVILLLVIFITATSIHDPIYRRLLYEENEDDKRIWCIVSYPSRLKAFNSLMHTFHFLAPFIINFISTIILIAKQSCQKSNLQINERFYEVVTQQVQKHKHLFVAPIILIILGIPRLIISFVSKCMQSTNDAWLFLFGYLISLTPSMLTYIVFISPSKFYKAQFRESRAAFQMVIRRRVIRIKNMF